MGIGTVQRAMMDHVSEDVESVCELGAQVPTPDLAGYHEDLTAEEVYREVLGINEYVSIDINGGTYEFDLNFAIPSLSEFDVVTNYGTTACIFDQGQAFKTIHDLCIDDGFMLHTLPLEKWGREMFYFYDIEFMVHLVAANDYRLVHTHRFERNGTKRGAYVLQKTNDNDFVYPIHRTWA